MAGIAANSASVTMLDTDTAPDKNEPGYIAGEVIVARVVHGSVPTNVRWQASTPAGGPAYLVRDGLGVRFTPISGVSGYYVLAATVDDATVYVLRVEVLAPGAPTVHASARFLAQVKAAVPPPPTGVAVYFNRDTKRLETMTPDGATHPVTPPDRSGTFTLFAGAGTISDASITASTVPVLRCDVAIDRGELTWTATDGQLACVSSDPSDASTYSYQLIG